MPKSFILLWLLVPLAAAAYHYGPGQDRIMADEAAGHIAVAKAHLEAEQFAEAVAAFDQAISKMPAGQENEIPRLRLEKAKAQMQSSGLPQAHKGLVSLLDDLGKDAATPPALVAETKSTLANAQYYMTWLLRLEGHAKEIWEPVIESSRQNYLAAAEFALQTGKPSAEMRARENLEAAIKLARIDLTELQGLPLPNQ
jgi:tetratricopeptide (TPR) repeat protein